MSGLRRLFDHANRGFPWPLRPPRTSFERLRRVDFPEKYREFSTAARAGIGILRTFLYPFAAIGGILSAIRNLPKFGVATRWSDFFPAYAQALLRNIPPVEYFLFGFSDPAVRRTSGDYLYWMDQPALQWLNRRRGADNRDVQDKARFADLCLQASLPHAGVLAEFRKGNRVAGAAPENWSGEEFWVKPTHGSGGSGCRLWRKAEDGLWHSGSDGLDPLQWIALLSQQDCVVQQHLRNHPDFNGLTNGSTAVARLITVLDRTGNATLIGCSVALPQGSADSTAGALGCVPDLETGAIVQVALADSDASTPHPDTGERLIGRVLPCWNESRELVLRAHRETFPAFASLGWDVVVTPEGPLLLETNSGWGTLGQQMHFGPLGRSVLGRIAVEELERPA